ncbi:MAG: hypothetical protein ABH952_09160 [Candidatus Omnitrophota bacterium]
MDEKVKESLKQICELVGQTLFFAQLMEKELAFLIMYPEIMKNNQLPDINRMNQEIEKLNECTFGQLLKKLKKHATMNDTTRKKLELSLERRNFLAHNFFSSYQGRFDNLSEHKIMRCELIKMRTLFKFIYDKLHQESYRNLKNIGLIRENIEEFL